MLPFFYIYIVYVSYHILGYVTDICFYIKFFGLQFLD